MDPFLSHKLQEKWFTSKLQAYDQDKERLQQAYNETKTVLTKFRVDWTAMEASWRAETAANPLNTMLARQALGRYIEDRYYDGARARVASQMDELRAACARERATAAALFTQRDHGGHPAAAAAAAAAAADIISTLCVADARRVRLILRTTEAEYVAARADEEARRLLPPPSEQDLAVTYCRLRLARLRAVAREMTWFGRDGGERVRRGMQLAARRAARRRALGSARAEARCADAAAAEPATNRRTRSFLANVLSHPPAVSCDDRLLRWREEGAAQARAAEEARLEAARRRAQQERRLAEMERVRMSHKRKRAPSFGRRTRECTEDAVGRAKFPEMDERGVMPLGMPEMNARDWLAAWQQHCHDKFEHNLSDGSHFSEEMDGIEYDPLTSAVGGDSPGSQWPAEHPDEDQRPSKKKGKKKKNRPQDKESQEGQHGQQELQHDDDSRKEGKKKDPKKRDQKEPQHSKNRDTKNNKPRERKEDRRRSPNAVSNPRSKERDNRKKDGKEEEKRGKRKNEKAKEPKMPKERRRQPPASNPPQEPAPRQQPNPGDRDGGID